MKSALDHVRIQQLFCSAVSMRGGTSYLKLKKTLALLLLPIFSLQRCEEEQRQARVDAREKRLLDSFSKARSPVKASGERVILEKWEVLDGTLCFHWQLCVLYCTCVQALVVRAFGHLINLRAINLVSVCRVDDVLAGTCLVRVTTMLLVNRSDLAGHVMFMFGT